MSLDLRVPIGVAVATFGVPATVTRPAPHQTPIPTSAIWVSPTIEDVPPGLDIRRVSDIKVLWLPLADVPTVPRGTLIVAPEEGGATEKTWRVDGHSRREYDGVRVIVMEAT